MRTASSSAGPAVRALHGAQAGLTATTAMTAALVAVERLGGVHPSTPRLVTEEVVPGAEHAPGPLARGLTSLTHHAFGAAGGALFALVAPHLPGPRVVKGLGFAAVVMLVSYEGWVPALGILPPQHEQPAPRALALAAGHAVYGVVLGLRAA
ncbi:MAG: DUF6789 family protein [Acidimicrobiia bacterium]